MVTAISNELPNSMNITIAVKNVVVPSLTCMYITPTGLPSVLSQNNAYNLSSNRLSNNRPSYSALIVISSIITDAGMILIGSTDARIMQRDIGAENLSNYAGYR